MWIQDTHSGALGTVGIAGSSHGAVPNTLQNRGEIHTLTRQACSMSINLQILKVSSSCGHPYREQWGYPTESLPSLRMHFQRPRRQRYNLAVRGGGRTTQVRILPISSHGHAPYGP
jgi:hypothetical protein